MSGAASPAVTRGPDPAVAGKRLLQLPERRQDFRHPFWHRSEPVLATIALDEGHHRLRQVLPASYEPLLRVKSCLDLYALAATGEPLTSAERRFSEPLLAEAVTALERCAALEQPSQPAFSESIAVAAVRLRAFAETGRWEPACLASPDEQQPWLYCGPLTTWAPRRWTEPLSLLLTVPDVSIQQVITFTDKRLAMARDRVVAVLRTPIVNIDKAPTMHAAQLLLVGGEAAFGHKHFAHFFPLESPSTTVEGADFTLVFANVHSARLARCSLPLLESTTGTGTEVSRDEVIAASLTWFRCHDLAHFWRAADARPDSGTEGAAGSQFDRLALEETFADCMGFCGALALTDAVALHRAFLAELLRYLSRRPEVFADTSAAALEVGHLVSCGVDPLADARYPADPDAAIRAAASLGELGRLCHDTLWGARFPSPELGSCLGGALAEGLHWRAAREPLFCTVPTDLDYVWEKH